MIVACGGGGGGNSGSDNSSSGGRNVTSDNTFTAASISAGDAPQQLTFNWTFNGSAVAAFRLEGNPDGASGFSQLDIDGSGTVDADSIESGDYLSGDTATLTLPIVLLHTDLINARYQIVALDGDGNELDRSDELSIMGLADEALIGAFKASNAEKADLFGYSVALSGDTLAVGAPYEDSGADGISTDGTGENDNSANEAGAVYIFTRNESGAWAQQAYLKASDSNEFGRFGLSLALSDDGDTLVVGAPQADVTADNGENSETFNAAGKVYVFTRDENGTWSQQASLSASNLKNSIQLGYSVALSSNGNILVVGTPYENSSFQGVSTNGDDGTDDGASETGAAYVFTRDSTGQWSQHAYVKASNAESDDRFGQAVAISGDGGTFAVGATGEKSTATGIGGDQSNNDSEFRGTGAVYVFIMSGDGSTWNQQAYVKASNSSDGDHFGASVALSFDGNTMAVGAPWETNSATGISTDGGGETDYGATFSGAVYLFSRDDADVWSQQAYIKASNTRRNQAFFGSSLDLSADGNTLAVGAPEEDSNIAGIVLGSSAENSGGTGNIGAVYVFTQNGGSWAQHAYVRAPVPGFVDYFGYSLDLTRDGRNLAAGAIQMDLYTPYVEDSGAVYLY